MNHARKLPPIPWTVAIGYQIQQISGVLDTIIQSVHDLASQRNLVEHQHRLETEYYVRDILKLEAVIMQNSQRIAHLYQNIEERELQIIRCMNMMKDMSPESQMHENYCECCCSVCDADDVVKCSLHHHNVCKRCINHACGIHNASNDIPVCEIPCCSMNECEGVHDAYVLGQCSEGRKLLQEHYFHNTVKDNLLNYVNKFSHFEIEKNLHFLRSDGTFTAFQCSVCGFGPITIADCDDLLAHHGQREGKDKIDNSCPNCKTLHKYSEYLNKWDGK